MSITHPTVGVALRDGEYPRPQLVREHYRLLDGECGFAYDDADVGLGEDWSSRSDVFDRTIILPFAPESPASGVGETGFHPVVWYRREIDGRDLGAAGAGVGRRIILHLGSVDHSAHVWVDGTLVATHEGGQTAFSADITHALRHGDQHAIVVRAFDDPRDPVVPRGKQDWHEQPHSIWYHRATGIRRSLWLETVPGLHITSLDWIPDVANATVRLELELNQRPRAATTVSIGLWLHGTPLATMSIDTGVQALSVDVPIAALRNGQAADELLWSPATPHLVDARVAIGDDIVDSYFGLRTVTVEEDRVMLNRRPLVLRSVLEQGYWPDTHYTPPSPAAMREEVELILRLGFNSVRIHQKVEDPRFLFWCDRLGLTVWGEAAAAYEFSARAVELYSAEWVRIVRSQRSHPSIITWVPFNESWGMQQVSISAAQRAYSLALTQLTRALDSSRPVISNDGWEHTDSDIVTVHDYTESAEVVAERYGEQIESLRSGLGPAGRPMGENLENRPIMLTEFGGVRVDRDEDAADGWGYSSASSDEDFQRRLTGLFGAVNGSSTLAGFCYTQLTDTGQEQNGLCDEHRVPKLPEQVIRALVLGRPVPVAAITQP